MIHDWSSKSQEENYLLAVFLGGNVFVVDNNIRWD
jgi:hypothetical protein